MEVDGSLFQIAMAEQNLNRPQVGTVFEQVSGEAVPEGVGMDFLADTASLQAYQITFVEIGWSAVCQRLPGNNHTAGFLRRLR